MNILDKLLPKVGDRIQRYELLEELGRGGFGVVFRGRQAGLDAVVAIKLMFPTAPDTSQQMKMLERFEQEARVINRLQHPSALKVRDFGTWEGLPFMVTEFVRGHTLEEILEAGPLPVERIVRIGDQILGCLAEAHSLGVIHRDLKPGNIMVREIVGEPDSTKVLDFGIAKVASEVGGVQTQTGQALGTPYYMAPEQCRALADLDGRVDLYALGLILAECITGRRVVQATDMVGAIYTHAMPGPLPFESAILDSPLYPVISMATAKERDRRYADALTMRRDLRQLASTTDSQVDLQPVPGDRSLPPPSQPSPLHTPVSPPSAQTPMPSPRPSMSGPASVPAPPGLAARAPASATGETLGHGSRGLVLLTALAVAGLGFSAFLVIDFDDHTGDPGGAQEADEADGEPNPQGEPPARSADELLASAEALLVEAQWEEAIATLEPIGLEAEAFAAADALSSQARAELLHREASERLSEALRDERVVDALSAWADIPPDSYYRQQILQQVDERAAEMAHDTSAEPARAVVGCRLGVESLCEALNVATSDALTACRDDGSCDAVDRIAALFESLCDTGDGESCDSLTSLARQQDFRPDLARTLLSTACDQRDQGACLQLLALDWRHGEEDAAEPAETEIRRRCLEENLTRACVVGAETYNALGDEQTYSRAAREHRSAAELGGHACQLDVPEGCLEEARGLWGKNYWRSTIDPFDVSRSDVRRVRAAYGAACEAGLVAACTELAGLEYRPDIINDWEGSRRRAEPWAERACELGQAEYCDGDGNGRADVFD